MWMDYGAALITCWPSHGISTLMALPPRAASLVSPELKISLLVVNQKKKKKKSCVKATLLIHVGYKEIIWEVEQAQRQDHSLAGFMPWGRNYWEKYTALLWVQWEEKVKSKICPEIERFSSWAQEKDSEASWKVHVSAFCTINTPLWALILILLENVSTLTLIGSNARKKKKEETCWLWFYTWILWTTSKRYKLNDCQASIPQARCF